MPFSSEIGFTSFLQYSSRGTSSVSRSSQLFTRAVKDDSFLNTPGNIRAISFAALRLSQEIPRHPVLQQLFTGDLIFVPVPRRAPLVTGGLWPTKRLCDEMLLHGIAGQVLPLLHRITAVQKSSTAGSGQRPGPQQHYESLEVDPKRPLIGMNHHLVILDDMVTRGATFFGCLAKLSEAYPGVRISCFAFIRTMSGVEINSILDPVSGVITLNPLHRAP